MVRLSLRASIGLERAKVDFGCQDAFVQMDRVEQGNYRKQDCDRPGQPEAAAAALTAADRSMSATAVAPVRVRSSTAPMPAPAARRRTVLLLAVGNSTASRSSSSAYSGGGTQGHCKVLDQPPDLGGRLGQQVPRWFLRARRGRRTHAICAPATAASARRHLWVRRPPRPPPAQMRLCNGPGDNPVAGADSAETARITSSATTDQAGQWSRR